MSLNDIAIRVREKRILASTTWRIKSGQNWAVLGPNGSGKSTLMRALIEEAPVVAGRITRHHPSALPRAMGYLSLELHRQIVAREQARDESRYFSGRLNDQLTAGQVLGEMRQSGQAVLKTQLGPVVSTLKIQHLLGRPIRVLSTGEMRRVLIARAFLKSRGFLILDEPFDGLDRGNREQLKAAINALMDSGSQVILVTHRTDEILPNVSHVICLKNCRVFCQGPREQVLTQNNLHKLYGRGADPGNTSPSTSTPHPRHESRQVMIRVRNATVRYGGFTVFRNLDWTVRKGENWAVVGPNGTGKTTLLRMITADHLQAYANDITLFGRRRGSGESIWDIKQRMGVVSSEMQINYRKPISAYDVVLSGFFDSVGLYRRADSRQRTAADEWVSRLQLTHLSDQRYDLLSFGERRMILLARAMVKSPEILVLDEPCQGLDPSNRALVLGLVDTIGAHTSTQILYVTHHLEELPGCITHTLRLGDGRYR